MVYLLRSAALTNYVEVARAAGLDPFAQLRAVHIGRQALLAPDTRIPAEAVGRLLERSALTAGVEDFGLRMAETRELSNLGPLAIAIREEPTLRRALDSMTRHLHLQNEALAMRVEDMDGLVVVRHEALVGLPGSMRQSAELVVGVIFRILTRFLGPKWKPHSICFRHSLPASTATHLRVFRMPVLFNQEFDGIVCPAGDLEAPLPSYDPSMARQVRQYLDMLLAQSDTGTADQVRKLVAILLPSGTCSIERVAEHLGVDARTVQRRLAQDGGTYSTIVSMVRADLVMRYIGNRRRPLSEVATLLGFRSLSAFSRWFAGQFGSSVSQWRATHDLDDSAQG